jgi:hypothetical protein
MKRMIEGTPVGKKIPDHLSKKEEKRCFICF